MCSFTIMYSFSALSDVVYATENGETTIISQFAEKYGLDSESYSIRNLYDFNGNSFVLVEFSDEGYAIYTTDTMRFIEGSAHGKSPYYGYYGTLYYLGPMSYYVESNGKIYDIINDEESNPSEYSECEYDFDSLVEEVSGHSDLSYNNVRNNVSSGFEIINGCEYFETATYPYNSMGSCGITAISLLLGYFDTYHNDNFVDDGMSDLVFMNKRVESHNNLSEIINMKPEGVGTTDDFGEYLFENYMHYNELFATIFGGYPMADMELKETMQDYIASRTSIAASSVTHYSGSIIYTHANPASYIEEDLPVILVLSKYDYQGNENGWHTVVAYGYDEGDDVFLVNYGWTSSYNAVILSDYTVYAYYAMKYTGEHVHSGNVVGYHHYSFLGTNYVSTLEVCGCGQIIPGNIEIEN